jgi:hypothetical protein
MASDGSVVISLRCSRAEQERLKRFAARSRRAMSNALLLLVLQALDAHERRLAERNEASLIASARSPWTWRPTRPDLPAP